MIINESFNKDTFSAINKNKPIKLLRLTRPNVRKKDVPISIVLRKSKVNLHNKENIPNLSGFSLNLSFKNSIEKKSDFEDKKQDSFNENLFISKYLNKSIKNEKDILNQTALNTKENTFIASMRQSENIPSIKNGFDINNKNDNNKLLVNIDNKNSSLKKIRKSFLMNIDYKNNNIDKNRAIEYRKRLKRVNSSFSQESIYYLDKKTSKDFANNNILYDNSAFNDSNKLNSSNNTKSKKDIFTNKVKNHSYSKGKIDYKKAQKYRFKINPIFSFEEFKNE